MVASYRDPEEIDEILNNNHNEEFDYFDCSNLMNGVVLPGLSSCYSDENESIWVSENLSLHIQQEEERYFIDNFEDAQKMGVRFF